jgi:RNA polymerase sigma-70 factor (sigma-E family)
VGAEWASPTGSVSAGVVVVDEPGSGGAPFAGFDSFVLARAGALRRSAWLLTGEPQLAEDLVQTALGKSYRVWTRMAPEEFEAYVRRVMFTSYLRWRRRLSFHERPVEHLPDGTAPNAARPSGDLLNALRTLPVRQRAVVVLRYFDDLTERETARVLGCSVGTVKSHTARALTALRQSTHLTDPSAGGEDG